MTTNRPLLLDLFCGAGGASMGYQLLRQMESRCLIGAEQHAQHQTT